MEASTYLNFNGQCEEAFAFYAKTFKGEVTAQMRWSEMPGGQVPPGMEKKIMHAHLKIGATSILASDSPPDRFTKPSGFGVALGVDSNEEAERVFAALSDGGNVGMPMGETFFAHRFGMVTDRYGTPWLIVHGKA
ncbi:MAG: VOC family protein [Alphaproteobacteria bacterium]|nr:VOC family protein [Alphaproteobacteria bacterium]MDE2014889.1 VOC family protein [Alphaproteobacteria bacterium]MDE2072445.1 VOC family protein [Alphaproteobacteria bacterium]